MPCLALRFRTISHIGLDFLSSSIANLRAQALPIVEMKDCPRSVLRNEVYNTVTSIKLMIIASLCVKWVTSIKLMIIGGGVHERLTPSELLPTGPDME